MPEAVEPLVCSVQRRAAAHPDRPAVLDREGKLTWGEFWRLTAVAAESLRKAGVGCGQGVLLCAPNHGSVAAAYFAAHALGAIAVPLAPETPPEVVAELAALAEVRAAFLARPLALPVTCLELPDPSLSKPQVPALKPVCRLEDPADLLFTTGTTGRRKGVVLTQGNIAQAARNINTFIPLQDDDVEVLPLPLSHSFGLGRLRCWARAGHCLALEPGMRNAAQ
ncbi:MAG: AMP-binding protein, partial [Pirellulales bacterium]|nr:AMP-binding protein [Pirellulales bacterium]